MKKKSKKILVTGAAGFIGFHLSKLLLREGYEVVGVDSLSPYYDVRLKHARLKMLSKYPAFRFYKSSFAVYKAFEKILKKEQPDEIVHLGAQAGVRYSLINPWAYSDANYLGTMNIFEAAHRLNMPRVIYASSSSVYGANTKRPFSEEDRIDTPISIYAATKRANELLAHSYNYLFKIEMIGLRFFTVYGPWGRPDLALFKFAKRIMRGDPIELYNGGKMRRSFTYIDDCTGAILALLEQPARGRNEIYNLGGSEAVPLERFVDLIEKELGKKTKRIMAPLQAGDVPETVADCSKARRDLGFEPKISIEEGIARFMQWFKQNEKFVLSLKEPMQ